MAVSETDKCLICNSKLTDNGQCPACDGAKINEAMNAERAASQNNTQSQNNRVAEVVTADFRVADERRRSKTLYSAYLIDPVTNEHYGLGQSTSKIGRDRSNDIAIQNDHYMSRHHALVLQIKGEFWVEDLGSTNCTLLNGKPVKERKPLVPGDKLTLGKTEFTFATE